MYRSSLLIIFVLLFVSDCKGAISDKRLCGDPTCSEPVSYAKTLLRYVSDDARILSFQANVKATVFSKSAGSKPHLWGVEVDGKRGYAPKDFIREYKVVKGKLEYVVSTGEDIVHARGKQDSQANGGLEEPPPDNEMKLPPFPNIGAAAEQVKENIPSSSETYEPYEVADGTTIYYSTDAPAEPILIRATTTDSNVQSTVQSKLDPGAKNSDVDTPNPSMVLPQPSTSSDASTVKEEPEEGSATEKIYKYLFSNFISEASGELPKEEEILAQDKDAEAEGDEPRESSQKVFIESTESGPVPIIIEPPESIIESDGNTKHQVSPSPASIDSLEKPTLNESFEEDEEDDAEDNEDNEEDEEEEYADSDEITYSGEPSPDSTIPSPSSDDGHGDSLPPTETEEFQREISDDNKSESQDPNGDTHPSSIETGVKSEPNANVVSEIVHDSTADILNGGHTQTESDTKVFGSLDEISDHLEQMGNASHVEVVENEFKGAQAGGSASVENTNTTEPVTDNPSDKLPQSHDLEDGAKDEAVDQTTTQSIPDSTPSPLSASHNPEMVSETTVDPHPDTISASTETTVDDRNENENFLPEKGSWNIIPDMVQETDKSSVSETLDLHTLPTKSESGSNGINIDIEPSIDQNGFSDTNTSESVDTSTVEAGTENTLDEIPRSNVPGIEETEVTSDSAEDQSVLTTTSTAEDSTETGYVDVLMEDSPLNVVTDIPAVETDAVTEDSSETSDRFFSNMFGSWFGSWSVPEEAETPVDMEIVEENAGRKVDSGARNSVWSYTRQPDSNQKPETPSSCSADSGIEPDCDKVLLPGNVPTVDSDNEAAIQQVMTEQDTNIPPTETWGYDGGSSQIPAYLGITAVSMVVIIVGHWFVEKMRCDSTYIKRINNLERALLYAELESKNFKEECSKKFEEDLEESQYKSVGLEEPEKIALLEEQLLAVLDTTSSLEEKNAALEEKNAGLQASLDVATEAGLELNRMLSDLLSTNKGSESLIGSVNDLQQQLNSQQATISNMKIVLNTKEAESESLRNNLTVSQGTIQSLERELNQLTETLNELLVEKATQENQFKCIKDELDVKLKSKIENEEKLAKEIDVLRCRVIGMESDVCTRDIETALLRECIGRLKEDSTSSDEEFKQLFNVAKAESASRRLLEERDRLSDELQGEKDARKLLEGHVEVITKEVDMLRKAVEQSEKDKVEAVTKHAVLADYFKDKESQLHKELGYRDALYMQTKGDATMTHEEVKSLHEQLDSYKSQIDTLKKEIVDQERGLKSQILAFEKKSHENWLVARQAERKLQESKLEAGLLRNRLTIVEKNASNAIQNDKALNNKTTDREMLDPNIGSATTPPLYPLDMNVGPAFNPHVQPPPPHGPLSPINHSADENLYRMWSSLDSPSPNSRSQPALRSLPPRISPANPVDITFTVEEAMNPASPFYGILSPAAPYDPFHGRPIQDRHNPDLYHIMPLLPYLSGPAPIMLPPPVLPNLPASHDRRPPPLGRMSSPPPPSPPPPRGHPSSPFESGRRHRRSPAHRYPSPERSHRGPRPRGGSPLERVSPSEQTPPGRGPRASLDRTSSPEHGRSYRRRSPSPSGRYSDSSPDSAPESRRYARRYDYSPESSYRGRSRTPSPTGFRPISREASNNQGSNRSSNHSYESDESNRRGGRL